MSGLELLLNVPVYMDKGIFFVSTLTHNQLLFSPCSFGLCRDEAASFHLKTRQ